jgi:hypothetical protein
MKQRPRIYYTESQKALMWKRWRKGDSLQQIAQLFELSCQPGRLRSCASSQELQDWPRATSTMRYPQYMLVAERAHAEN